MSWTDPRTWVSGEVPTAAQFNAHLRDNFKAIGDPWQSYTPTWAAATTNPSIGNGSVAGRYIQAGNLIIFSATITAGSTTNFGSGAWTLTAPVPATALPRIFQGIANDADGGLYPVYGILQADSTTFDLRRNPTTAGSFLQAVQAGQPFTWASGDQFNISGTYEAGA